MNPHVSLSICDYFRNQLAILLGGKSEGTEPQTSVMHLGSETNEDGHAINLHWPAMRSGSACTVDERQLSTIVVDLLV